MSLRFARLPATHAKLATARIALDVKSSIVARAGIPSAHTGFGTGLVVSRARPCGYVVAWATRICAGVTASVSARHLASYVMLSPPARQTRVVPALLRSPPIMMCMLVVTGEALVGQRGGRTFIAHLGGSPAKARSGAGWVFR
jgi:hypothetical protein